MKRLKLKIQNIVPLKVQVVAKLLVRQLTTSSLLTYPSHLEQQIKNRLVMLILIVSNQMKGIETKTTAKFSSLMHLLGNQTLTKETKGTQ